MIKFHSTQPDLNSVGKNKVGYIHYSGIILDTLDDDVEYLSNILTDNIDECVRNLKQIQRGQFVLIYSTTDFTIVYTDITQSRRIFEIDYTDAETIFCDDVGLHQLNLNQYTSCSLIPTNYIVVYDREFKVIDSFYIIDRDLNLKQDVDSFEPLIDEAISLLDNIHKKFKNINLLLSDGYDSGFVHSLSLMNKIQCNTTTLLGAYLSDVDSTNIPNSDILHQRLYKQKNSFPTSKIYIHKGQDLQKKFRTEYAVFKKYLFKNNFVTEYDFAEFDMFYINSTFPKDNINLIIEMDYILFDAGFMGRKRSQHRSKFGGIFPKNLGLHHTWWLNHNSVLPPLDIYPMIIGDYLGTKNYQFYSTKSFLTEYMKLDRKLKSNNTYKPFITHYINKYDYPYAKTKNGKRIPYPHVNNIKKA